MCYCLRDDVLLSKGDFNSPNIYQNKFLTGRFRLILDKSLHLEAGKEWSQMLGGGFSIDIAGFCMQDDTSILVQFY